MLASFLAGLERARLAGRDLAAIGSVVSFFVSRVDTEVDARLDKTGTAQAAQLRGQPAIANARLGGVRKFDASWPRLSEPLAATRRRP